MPLERLPLNVRVGVDESDDVGLAKAGRREESPGQLSNTPDEDGLLCFHQRVDPPEPGQRSTRAEA